MILYKVHSLDSIKVSIVVLMLCSVIVNSTVDLGIFQGSRCRIGTVYRPSSCTQCICGLLNLMLCRQTCVPDQSALSTTIRPLGPPPSGPTVVPILIPSIFRRPHGISSNSTSEDEPLHSN